MKIIIYISFIAFLLPKYTQAGDGPKKDTSRLKVSCTEYSKKTGISKTQLIRIVDSLLDLKTIPLQEIELIRYYSSILSSDSEKLLLVKNGSVPATSFYNEFDETLIFQMTPESEFPENQIIKIESDSLGVYHHPKKGPINSRFGWRDGKIHKGIDIDLNRGDSVVAAFDGMVRIAQAKGAYGNIVIIRHYNGLETVYAHLSKIKVKPGQVISSGQLVGLGGNTGRSSGPHLHFEVRFKGHALNPTSFISFTEYKTYHNFIVIKKSKHGISAYPSNAGLHTIERGDSWLELAKRYGLSLKELCLLNGTDKLYYLKIGQTLRVN